MISLMQSTCSECGAALPPDAPRGLCPACVFQLDEPTITDTSSQSEAPIVGGAFGTRRFGDYELLEEIARGGMGIVYKARQLSLDRIVAIKMILFGSMARAEQVRRFRIEASAAGSLQHPNIVTVHEVGLHEGQHFLAMDYVDGPNLARLVYDQPLPARKAAAYLKAIAEAVQFAHNHGILHRDLKPSNVLIGSDDRPRVTDFGLAKRFDTESSLTLSGHVLGSPNYMPPEQAGGARTKASRTSDVYSLGAILYHLLTARPPFRAETLIETLQQVQHMEPISPRLLSPSLPRDLETICLKCLEKDPAKRYPTAGDLAGELNRFLEDEPIRARPVSPTEKAWRWCRRRPALSALGATTLVAIIATALISTIAAVRVTLSHKAQERETYHASIQLANHYIRDGSIDRAREILMECPARFRHWEWGRLMFLCHQDLLSIQAHTNQVIALAVHPRGQRAASLAQDGQAKVFDLENGRELFAFGGPSNAVLALAFSPNGQQLALACSQRVARIFDAENWRPLVVLSNHVGAVSQVAFSPESQILATVSEDKTLRLSDAITGREIHRLTGHREPILSLSLSPNGRVISRDRLSVKVWNAITGQLLVDFSLPAAQYQKVFANPLGEQFISIDAQRRLQFWKNPQTNRDLAVVKGSSDVQKVFFSPDGKLFCVGGEDGSAGVWNVETGEELFPIPGKVHEAHFSPDAQRLLTRCNDKTAKVWDVQTGRELLTLRGHTTIISQGVFSPDGSQILTAGRDGVLKLWSASPARELINEPKRTVWSATYSPDGTKIAAAPIGTAKVWDAQTGHLLRRFPTGVHWSTRTVFSPDGKRLATGGVGRWVKVWDIETGRELFTLWGHTRSVLDIDFSPDGRSIATCSIDQTVRLWCAETGQELHVLRGHTVPITAVRFSPDGKDLVSASYDGTLRFWRADTGRLSMFLVHPNSNLRFPRFSPDGRFIVGGSSDRTIRKWDAQSGTEVSVWKGRSVPWDLAFSPDGKRLAVCSSETSFSADPLATLEIHDAENGRELLSMEGHLDYVSAVHFSPDGRRLVSSSWDYTARQWETFPWDEKDYPGASTAPLAERLQLYARQYWKERLSIEQRAVAPSDPEEPELPLPFERSAWPPRAPEATQNLVDLTDHFHGLLHLQWLAPRSPWNSDNDLASLPTGIQTLGGIRFDIRGVIQLRPRETGYAWVDRFWKAAFPERVNGIRVQQKFRLLHLLHGTVAYELDGVAIGSLVWHYADGFTRESEIIYGRDLRDWWTSGDAKSETDVATVAWTGTNAHAEEQGSMVRLYRRTYENPRPEMEVTSIDYVSKLTRAAPFLIALTVEP